MFQRNAYCFTYLIDTWENPNLNLMVSDVTIDRGLNGGSAEVPGVKLNWAYCRNMWPSEVLQFTHWPRLVSWPG